MFNCVSPCKMSHRQNSSIHFVNPSYQLLIVSVTRKGVSYPLQFLLLPNVMCTWLAGSVLEDDSNMKLFSYPRMPTFGPQRLERHG
jgi:hypothetical protein